MTSRISRVLALAPLLAVVAAGQMQDEYLDVFVARVKPDKRAAFDVIEKKIADANRRHKGNTWLASEVIYGDQDTVYFVDSKLNLAAIDQGFGAFMGALTKVYGPAGAGKLLADFNNCVVSTRAELRRRRWDLSSNVPADAAALFKLTGESRWVRTVMVRVRPGRLLDYEAQLRLVKAAAERATPQLTTLVSQSAVGQQGNVFYLTSFGSTLGTFDGAPPLRKLLGEAFYQSYAKVVADSVLGVETIITRFVPEYSNAREEVAAASPDFWRPKPPMVSRAKPKV